MSASTPLTIDQEIVYPESDGRPMAENTLQFRWIQTLQGNTDLLFADDPNVFVAGDLLWYPVQGQNTIRTAPDVLVAFGRPKGYRGSYLQWREGNIAPQVVWEVLSPGNRAGELDEKFAFFERYGVDEYYQYDPDHGVLRGWLRNGAGLVEIDNIAAGWISPRLGIRLEMRSGELHVFYPDGRPFLTFIELGRLAEHERQRAEAEGRRAETEGRRAEAEGRRAETERLRAEKEHQRAEAERERAERLAEYIRSLGIEPPDPAR